MESPRMYEEGSPDNTRKDLYKLPSSVFNFGDDNQQHRAVLDPELENVVDLEELINADLSTLESVSGHLTIDNFLPPCDLELLESGQPFGNQNISKFVPDTVVSACMTNFNEGSSNNSGANGHQTVTIKTEDLDLTPCQSTGRARNPSSSASSCSDYSSRSTTPKSPVVYECRKPGRKPSAGGPVRNRKREPPKDTPEYYEKRARNNVAVRKSREKAKLRQGETEERVSLLTSENERLQKKVDLLSKELNVLKSLFINVGASLPDNFEEILRS